MRALIVLGATGSIGMGLLSNCYQEHTFDKYVLYGRNAGKLDAAAQKDACHTTVCIPYDMENEPAKDGLVPKDHLRRAEELTLVLLAFTIEPISRIGTMAEPSYIKEIQNNIHVNVLSQVNFIGQYAAFAAEHGIRLKIVFIDSGAAYTPIRGWSMYCAAKAYMDMYLQCLACENDYPLVLFEPGVIDTGMQDAIRKSSPDVFDRVEEFRAYKENGVLHSPKEVARQLFDRYLKEWTASGIRERYRA